MNEHDAVETFVEPQPFVPHSGFAGDRREALRLLDPGAIDSPIVDIVTACAALPHAFTLQCCYGHFLCSPDQDMHTLAPIPDDCAGPVRYRIAYVAFCVENSDRGRAFHAELARIPDVDPGFIQFGSPDWFRERWPNSYALQVEPVAHRFKDEALLDVSEARRTAMARDGFFARLRRVLADEAAAAESDAARGRSGT